MAEQRFVEPPVAGSSPAGHPNSLFFVTARYAARMNSRTGRILVALILVAFVGLMVLPLLAPTGGGP
jgi:hypothetical protein